MHSPTIIQLALVLISGVWALVLPRPPPQNRTFFDTWGRVYPKRLCPWEMVDFCCDSLDWSGPQVKCVGPGLVFSLQQCNDYKPRPMCCCYRPVQTRPNLPPLWAIMTCDKDCHVLNETGHNVYEES